jgi:spore coat protein CotH
MTAMKHSTESKPNTYRALGASLVLALIATLLLGVSPSKAANPIALTDIYDNFSVTKVYLEVPQASEASLNNSRTFKTWVAAKVKFVNGDRESAQMSIGMRLKGSTSIQPLRAKPSMKLKFNWGASLSGARFLGLKNMTLHSMTQDTSLIHEVSSYRLFNEMGVVAPKTGWAEVFVNGTSKGIYANIETPDDLSLIHI